MSNKRLIPGFCAILAIVGLILICFSPGGFFNTQGGRGTIDVPGVQITLEADRGPELTRPGPVIGFVLLGAGIVGLVVATAMKRGTP